MRISFLLCAFLCTISSALNAQVLINEFSAANYDDIPDDFNDYSDWIELYNSGSASADIGGFYLSDDVNEPMKWTIPAGTAIGPGEFLIIWASGLNITTGVLHTDFKLTQGKQEDVVFSDPSGAIVDSYTDISNQMNHSRGRTTDGASTWSIFVNPTQGGPNTNGYEHYAEVEIITPAGFYSGPVNVVMNTPDSDAGELRYTTDGSVPTPTSTLYTGPVSVTATTVIRARAFSSAPPVLAGFVETNTYFINDEHTIDIISISGEEVETLLNGSQIEPVGHLELFSPEGELLAEAEGDFNEHGNDSWAYPQRGLDYITQDELGYGDELHHQIFQGKDRDGFQRLILKGAASDNYPFETGGAHIRDAYVQSLSQLADLRVDERTYEPCVIYVNGQYWGVYEIREKVDDLDFTDYYYDQGAGQVDFIKTWGGTWVEYGSDADWDDLHDFILGSDMTDQANYEYVEELYNTGSLIDYFLLNSYVVCADWLNWNTGWWRGRNPDGDKKKWRYILWDMDAVFGHYVNFTGIPDQSANADPCDPEQLGNPGGQGHVPIWNTLLENEEFFSDYINRYAELSTTYFSCEFMLAHLDSLVGLIEPEMPAHIARWGGSMAEWQNNVQDIRDFIEERCEIINTGYLDCYPELSGPYDVVFYADPPEGGRIDLPNIEINSYPYNSVFFGGVDVPLDADENEGYIFSHWTVNNNVFTPDEFSEEIVVNFSANDTLIAHFVADVSYPITLNAVPETGGTITINGTVYDSFPVTIDLSENVEYTATATPDAGYGFENWDTDLTLTGPYVNPEATFTVTAEGYLTANFFEIVHEVSFNVSPEGAGQIEYNGEILEELPAVKNVPEASEVHLEATPVLPFHEFSHWSFLTNIPDPDEETAEVDVIFTQPDVVIANFSALPNFPLIIEVEPKGAGWVRIPDELIKEFPFQKQLLGNENYLIEAIQRGAYKFSHWEVVYGLPIQTKDQPSVNYNLISETKLIAHFEERFSAVFVPNAFTPNGDGFNDILKVYGLEVKPEDFKFSIFNHWGEELWSTTDINEGWNGTADDSEYLSPPGIYAYYLRYRDAITDRPVERIGDVLIIR